LVATIVPASLSGACSGQRLHKPSGTSNLGISAAELMTVMFRSLALGALAVLILMASSPASAQDVTPRRLVVTGTGEASARPDVAVISAGVVVQAETASAALAENTRAMNGVLEQLRAAGLAPEDVQTSQFAVTPLYDTRPPDPQRTEPPRIVGYQVSNQVRARVRDIARLGATLDALVGAGANSIDGPYFEIADSKEVLGQARDAAVADALAKARRYATVAGVKLGEIVAIEEAGSYAPPRPMMRAEAMAASVPIEPGQTELSAAVTITFALQ
jgi:uncharacterized protein YggE